MTDGGFIKLWRKFLANPIMQHDGLCRLWVTCLLKANWKDTAYLIPGTTKSMSVPRGAFVTTRARLHAEMYPKDDDRDFPIPAPITMWRWLLSLEKMECLKLENVNNRCTLVKIVKYETYQSQDSEREQPVNSRRTTDEQPSLEEEGEEGEEGARAASQNDAHATPPPAAAKDATNDDSLSPAWLARKWVDRRRGTKGRDELDRARTTFEEMIRLGCNPAKIAAEIDNQARRRTEPVWEIEERVMRAEGIWKDKFAGHGQKTSLTEAAGEMFEWAKQREANDLR